MTKDIINHIVDKNYSLAEETFGEVIQAIVEKKLEHKKRMLAAKDTCDCGCGGYKQCMVSGDPKDDFVHSLSSERLKRWLTEDDMDLFDDGKKSKPKKAKLYRHVTSGKEIMHTGKPPEGFKLVKEEGLEEKRGLWDNIWAKRRRGEKMRKPGDPGAPSEKDLVSARNEETSIPAVTRSGTKSVPTQGKVVSSTASSAKVDYTGAKFPKDSGTDYNKAAQNAKIAVSKGYSGKYDSSDPNFEKRARAPSTTYGSEKEANRDSVHEETLDEARIKIVKARIRAGKVQRRKKVSNVPGYTLRGGQLKKMTPMERRRRRMGQRRGKIKRRAKMSRALVKRQRSLRKRSALGLPQ